MFEIQHPQHFSSTATWVERGNMPPVYPPANSSIVWFDLFGPISDLKWSRYRALDHREERVDAMTQRLQETEILATITEEDCDRRSLKGDFWEKNRVVHLDALFMLGASKVSKIIEGKHNWYSDILYIIHWLFVKNPWIADSLNSEAVTALPGQLRPAVRLRSLPRRRHSAGPGRWKQKRQLHGWRR